MRRTRFEGAALEACPPVEVGTWVDAWSELRRLCEDVSEGGGWGNIIGILKGVLDPGNKTLEICIYTDH